MLQIIFMDSIKNSFNATGELCVLTLLHTTLALKKEQYFF